MRWNTETSYKIASISEIAKKGRVSLVLVTTAKSNDKVINQCIFQKRFVKCVWEMDFQFHLEKKMKETTFAIRNYDER